MTDPTPCLHCEIIALAQRFGDEHHLPANEVAFKLTEVLADIVAGIGSREGRRQMTRSVVRSLFGMIKHQVQVRQAVAAPDHEERRFH